MSPTGCRRDALRSVVRTLLAVLLAAGGAAAASPTASLMRREAGDVMVDDDVLRASSELDVARAAQGKVGAKWPAPTRRMPAVCADSVVAETCALLQRTPSSQPGSIAVGDLRVAFGCNRDDRIADLVKAVTGTPAPMNAMLSCKALCTGAQAYLQRNAKQFVMPPASDTACAEDVRGKWQCDLEVTPPTVTKLVSQRKRTAKGNKNQPQNAKAKAKKQNKAGKAGKAGRAGEEPGLWYFPEEPPAAALAGLSGDSAAERISPVAFQERSLALPSPKWKKTNKAAKAGKAGAAGKHVSMLSFPEEPPASALAGLSGDSAAQRISPVALVERYNLSADSYPYQWYSDDKTQCQYFDTSMVNAVVRLAQLFRFYPRVNTAYVYSLQAKQTLHNESAVIFLRGLALAEVFNSLTLRDMLYGNTLDEQMSVFGGGGSPLRSQDEVKQILWRAFSFIGNQMMRGTQVEHYACKKSRESGTGIMWVKGPERPEETIWMPTNVKGSFDKNGYFLIHACHWAVEFSEADIPIFLIHEMIHLAGPTDNRQPFSQLTQTQQLSNAYNYHNFAAKVVKETTRAEQAQLR